MMQVWGCDDMSMYDFFFITFSYILVEYVAFLDSLELKKARNYMVLISQHRGTISINVA